MIWRIFLGVLCATAVSAAWAQQPQTVRIRGTIEQVDGAVVVVKSRDGIDYRVMSADDPQIAAVVNASLANIKQGSFIGVVGMPQADGSQKALEVHIFPESMRGVGEGHRPWDLQPKSTMTNASVEQTVASVDGQTMMVKYKDGEKKIIVSPETPVVAFVLDDKSDLKAGAKVFIAAATKQPDGTLQARVWRVGRDGVTPPM